MSIAACSGCLLLLAAGCGGRSGLPNGESSGGSASATGGGPSTSCTIDDECGTSDACTTRRCNAGTCEDNPISCDDFDVCTEDSCDPSQGCLHRALALDMDRDGHKSPRPGFAPGAAGACGDDCNDLSAAAFPGNAEVCDGIDNDCNGVVDDGKTYAPSTSVPILVSAPDDQRAYRGGFVATADAFVFTYTAVRRGQPLGLIKSITPSGRALFETEVSDINAETYAGALTWSGDSFATAWEDARQGGDYEIYFRRFGVVGQKLGPEVRISNAPGKSLSPDIVWNQSEYLLAWGDRRNAPFGGGDVSEIFAQRLALDGSVLGENLLLVGDDDPVAESPSLALGPTRVGLAYTTLSGGSHLGFRVFDSSLKPVGSRPAPFGSDVFQPSVHFVRDRFVVLWTLRMDESDAVGPSLWASTFDLNGQMREAPRAITSGATHARSHAALPLGDRLLVMWADDFDSTFQIYWEILAPDLTILQSRQRLVESGFEALGPAVAVGPGGKIGVLLDGLRTGQRQVYFTSLDCRNGAP